MLSPPRTTAARRVIDRYAHNTGAQLRDAERRAQLGEVFPRVFRVQKNASAIRASVMHRMLVGAGYTGTEAQMAVWIRCIYASDIVAGNLYASPDRMQWVGFAVIPSVSYLGTRLARRSRRVPTD